MDAARPASKFGCVLGYPGPLPCRGCPPSCPEHPEAARRASTEQLAADVRASIDRDIERIEALTDRMQSDRRDYYLAPHLAARASLDALVARVADLEAQVEKYDNDRRTAMGAAERFREQGMADAVRAEEYLASYNSVVRDLRAAEAQVAALTQMLADVYDWIYARERQMPLPSELGDRVRGFLSSRRRA